MPPGEVTAVCECGYRARVPIPAIRRDNTYCSQCGKKIPLAGVRVETETGVPVKSTAKARRPYRPAKRR